MTGDQIPDSNHISRYCSPMRCSEGGGVTAACFMLRNNERYLSVDCLEMLSQNDRNEQIKEIRTVLNNRLNLNRNARIAVFNTGVLKEKVSSESEDNRDLSVIHEPYDNYHSHCGIYGIELQDDIIAELIAEAVQETYSTIE